MALGDRPSDPQPSGSAGGQSDAGPGIAGPASVGQVGPDPLFESRFGDRFDGLAQLIAAWRVRPLATAGTAAIVLGIVVVGWWLGRPDGARPVEDQIPFAPGVVSAPDPAAGDGGPAGTGAAGPAPGGGSPGSGSGGATVTSAPEPVSELVVHVAGAVVRPGIVRLAPGSRVIDAVDAAGGATPEADVDQLNLAAPLSDGWQITVPRQGETAPSPTGIAPVAPGVSAQAGPGPPLDLNRASAVELEQLPGIGPSLAAAIVAWREEHGPFSTIDRLLDVPGIGPAKLTALIDHVVV